MRAKPPLAEAKRASEAEPLQGEHGDVATSRFLVFHAVPSWLISTMVHVVMLLVMALLTFGPQLPRLTHEFTMRPEDDWLEEVDTPDFEDPLPEKIDVGPEPTTLIETDLADTTIEPDEFVAEPVSEAADIQPTVAEFDPLGELAVAVDDLPRPMGDDWQRTAPLGKRTATTADKIRTTTATEASEATVARALAWIVSRQARDGGWNFNHNLSANPRPCPNPGTAEKARNGATGIALMPLLGAGQTHKDGKYKKEVTAGLRYLIQKMKVKDRTGSWHESDGSMYSHGIAAIAMCEAYAMTHDKELLAPAQLSLNYIVFAQDPVGGGWRYQPKQAGDTSAMGWQLMALKSGHMAYLEVPKGTILGATKFLDSVQADSGAQYGYTAPAKGRKATNAVGMLSRMYLGWKRDNAAVQRAVALFDKAGPSKTDMYYNYYATQVVKHHDGEPWKRWNDRARDWLIDAQSKDGVTAGSWYFGRGDHGATRGGRLYTTAMATMMLEVPYRHPPLYRKGAIEEDFPL